MAASKVGGIPLVFAMLNVFLCGGTHVRVQVSFSIRYKNRLQICKNEYLFAFRRLPLSKTFLSTAPLFSIVSAGNTHVRACKSYLVETNYFRGFLF